MKEIEEKKILEKGLKIFARIIAQEMIKDGIHQKAIFGDEKNGNLDQCKINRQKLVA